MALNNLPDTLESLVLLSTIITASTETEDYEGLRPRPALKELCILNWEKTSIVPYYMQPTLEVAEMGFLQSAGRQTIRFSQLPPKLINFSLDASEILDPEFVWIIDAPLPSTLTSLAISSHAFRNLDTFIPRLHLPQKGSLVRSIGVSSVSSVSFT